MYRAALEGVLGFTKRGNDLRIEPCVPPAWRDFTIEYRHGSSTYAIAVRNPDAVSTGVARVEVDGADLADRVVRLVDDGSRHDVIVTMGARAPT
jgi:cyclic beta-1,2-glucan synthetase